MTQPTTCPTRRWRGVLAVPNTPFCRDGSLDLGSLQRLADYMAFSGTPAVLLFGVAAETGFLTEGERIVLFSTFQERSEGRYDLIVSVAADSLAEMTRQAKAVRHNGGMAINIRLPGGLTSAEQLHWISAVANEGPDTIMLQDLSFHDGGFTDDLLLSAIEAIPQLVSLKIETVDSIGKIMRLRKASPRAVHFCSGHPISSFLDALANGVDAVMPTSLTPTLCHLARLMISGREDEARRLFSELQPLFNHMIVGLPTSIAVNKKLRVAEAVFSTDYCRFPDASKLRGGDAPHVDRLVSDAVSLQARLGLHPRLQAENV
jgi:4-hydroxy-tetrahydrodipicolinate synthase